MPASAFLLAFAAAWIHGVGNVIAGHRREPEAAFAVMLVVGVVAFAPVAILTWDVEAAAVPYIAAGLAAVIAHEHVTGRRFAGAVLVAAGVALVALGQ